MFSLSRYVLICALWIPACAYAGFFPERTLRIGMQGDDVREFQQALNETIATATPIALTGFYGPRTEQLVRRFQEKEGIVRSGTPAMTGYGSIGSRTRTALRLAALMGRCTWDVKPTRRACLGTYYETFAQDRGTVSALRLIEAQIQREKNFDVQCHEVMHEIGHAGAHEFKTLGDAFVKGTDLCQNGYYHGVVEEFLRDRELTEISPKELRGYCDAARFASSTEPALNCAHGLGHALVYMTARDLPKALVRCVDLGTDEERGECAAGAFMQYSFADALLGIKDGAMNKAAEPCLNIFFDGGQCWLNEAAKVIARDGNATDTARRFCAGLSTKVRRDTCLAPFAQ